MNKKFVYQVGNNKKEIVRCQETDLVLFISYITCLPKNVLEKIDLVFGVQMCAA